jgi:hypothetical protein
MDCKNCGKSLGTDQNYCTACGAKFIRNRITFKSLWLEVMERFFNLDNTFIKTFLHLLTKPEAVIGGYIGGIRKKYLDPLSYLGIALTISGLFVLLLRKYFVDKINFEMLAFSGTDAALSKKIMNITLDIGSFVFVLYIPILAFAGWLIFNQKKYLLSEYMVVGVYTLAHYSILSFPISLLILAIVPEYYLILAIPMFTVMMLYATYVANRLNGTDLLKSIMFILIFIVGYFGISIFLNLLFLLTGLLELNDFLPKGTP